MYKIKLFPHLLGILQSPEPIPSNIVPGSAFQAGVSNKEASLVWLHISDPGTAVSANLVSIPIACLSLLMKFHVTTSVGRSKIRRIVILVIFVAMVNMYMFFAHLFSAIDAIPRTISIRQEESYAMMITSHSSSTTSR